MVTKRTNAVGASKHLPFDVDKALSGGWDVYTNCGRRVTQLVRFDSVRTDFKLEGVCEGDIESWTLDGHYTSDCDPHSYDLHLREPAIRAYLVAFFEQAKPAKRERVWAFRTRAEAEEWLRVRQTFPPEPGSLDVYSKIIEVEWEFPDNGGAGK